MSAQTKQQIVEAAKHADWMQVVYNNGPPCFHFEPERGRFCLRAQRWAGHSTEHAFTDHVFVPLDELLSQVTRPDYCKCAFTDPDGTFVPGEACAIHPDVTPQRAPLTSNERCPHGINLTANPPCHFCDHQQYVEWVSPQLERLGHEMADNERLREILKRIKIPDHCSLVGLSDAHTLGYWMGLAKGFANLAAQAVSGDSSAPETKPPQVPAAHRAGTEPLSRIVGDLEWCLVHVQAGHPLHPVLTRVIEQLRGSPVETSLPQPSRESGETLMARARRAQGITEKAGEKS